MLKMLKESFDGFGLELVEKLRAYNYNRIDDAVFEEKIINIEKTIMAMLEAGVDKDVIIQMLQKHWDMRLSEATECVKRCSD